VKEKINDKTAENLQHLRQELVFAKTTAADFPKSLILAISYPSSIFLLSRF
jgi:hypothetical protein